VEADDQRGIDVLSAEDLSPDVRGLDSVGGRIHGFFHAIHAEARCGSLIRIIYDLLTEEPVRDDGKR
jgi:hypothetical protein